jgi:hypothetical protein
MATAFWGTIIIKGDNGKIQADRFDSSDVTLAYVTFKSTGGLAFLDVQQDGYITDMFTNITSAGDTKYFKLYINQQDTNVAWAQAGSFPNINNRMFNLNPIRVLKGQRIQIQAVT